jgi:hypothetical protein
MIKDLKLSAQELRDQGLGKDRLIDDYLRKTDAIEDLQKQANYSFAGNPTVTDDQSKGWSVGSKVYNGSNLYECVDNTVGAAVWLLIG